MKSLFSRLRSMLSVNAAANNLIAAMPSQADVSDLISEIRSSKLSYCGPPKLENIAEAVAQVRLNAVSGDYLEAGVALGGSAILIGRLKSEKAKLNLYDVFEMIPAPNENDGEDAHERYEVIASGVSEGLGNNQYYGYVDDLITEVKDNLRQFGLDPDNGNVNCIAGLFENTLPPVAAIAFAHIDCDWYDSVKVCIEKITPNLSPGGIIIFDDYSSYSGCRRAVDEWLDIDDRFERIFHRRSLGVRRKRKS